jgi:hypothetical protein
MSADSIEDQPATSGFVVYLLTGKDTRKSVGALELRKDPAELAQQIAGLLCSVAADPAVKKLAYLNEYALLRRLQVVYIDGFADVDTEPAGGLQLAPTSARITANAREVLPHPEPLSPQDQGFLF